MKTKSDIERVNRIVDRVLADQHAESDDDPASYRKQALKLADVLFNEHDLVEMLGDPRVKPMYGVLYCPLHPRGFGAVADDSEKLRGAAPTGLPTDEDVITSIFRLTREEGE